MLKSIRLPIALLFVITAFTNFSSPVNTTGFSSLFININDSAKTITAEEITKKIIVADQYSLMDLDKKGLSKKAFDLALKGYGHLVQKKLVHNKNILTVIDFSKPSSEKRLFVIDLKNNKVLFQSLVAHGRNSGLDYATSFSNQDDSHKSSLGFYVTLNTYSGECGYALKLKGCEKGFNDKAYERAIVIHGSEYVTEQFLQSNGFVGRSWGCPALSEKISRKVIDVIKNGTCLFLYHPTKKYLMNSPVLKG